MTSTIANCPVSPWNTIYAFDYAIHIGLKFSFYWTKVQCEAAFTQVAHMNNHAEKARADRRVFWLDERHRHGAQIAASRKRLVNQPLNRNLCSIFQGAFLCKKIRFGKRFSLGIFVCHNRSNSKLPINRQSRVIPAYAAFMFREPVIRGFV